MSRKVPNKVGKILMLAGLMAFAKACKKPPVPEPEPTHHYPETIYVPFEFMFGIPEAMPNADTIRFYADKPDVKAIIMDLKPMDSLFGGGWTWRVYKKARDTLYYRKTFAPDKVWGRGEIIVPNFLPDSVNYQPGIHRADSADLARLGFILRKWQYECK